MFSLLIFWLRDTFSQFTFFTFDKTTNVFFSNGCFTAKHRIFVKHYVRRIMLLDLVLHSNPFQKNIVFIICLCRDTMCTYIWEINMFRLYPNFQCFINTYLKGTRNLSEVLCHLITRRSKVFVNLIKINGTMRCLLHGSLI